LDAEVKSVDELPIWNYDGSSTNQAPGADSEVYLKPVRIFPDPFRGGKNILVLCETYTPDMEPLPTNTRYNAAKLFQKIKDHHPWFGLEQEYTLFEYDQVTPLGWPRDGYPGPQGPYYCGIGTDKSYGRLIVESHYRACLYSGIQISGINSEVMPAQWEFQVGPCEGIESGDQMWIARYLLERICEEFGVCVSFDPKPIPGDWNGAGCHPNYSTASTRADGGYAVIEEMLKRLEKKHTEHIQVYGVGNERRLTGHHETARIDKFSYGVANRGCSVRIPRTTAQQKKGYFEDRRPASNMDPYVVTAKLAETSILG
jgi:glutamine synthetase